MVKIVALVVIVTFAACTSLGEEPNHLLRQLTDKSEAVVAGTVTEAGVPSEDEAGVVCRATEIEVTATIKGPLKVGKMRVEIVRFEVGEDHRPVFKKGEKYVYFLKRRSSGFPEWVTSDHWFAAQPYSASLCRAVADLARKKE